MVPVAPTSLLRTPSLGCSLVVDEAETLEIIGSPHTVHLASVSPRATS